MTPDKTTGTLPHSPSEAPSIKCENHDPSPAVADSGLSKEAKQQYLIVSKGNKNAQKVADALRVQNEIRKLVADCEDFIGLVPGPGGVPEIVASPNVKTDRWAIIGEAQRTFSAYLSMNRPGRKANSLGLAKQPSKTIKQEPMAATPNPSGSVSISVQRPLKRHRSRTSATASSSNLRSRHGRGGMRSLESSAAQIRVDDYDQLADWYKNAFLRLQQVACRLVAKVWIKKIHPKKQSTHPYNGQMPRNAIRDPNRTRPPYWPDDVRHREPDHIGREERTRLLVHLILKTPQPVLTNPAADSSSPQQYVFARDLLECLEPKKGERELTEERWETIQQIINAREMQERYDMGEIDGDTLIFLRDYRDDDGSNLRKIDSDDDEDDRDDSGPIVSTEGSEAAADDREPTPGSSSQTSGTDRTSSDNPTSTRTTRGSVDHVGFPGRQIAACRSRPSFNTGQSTGMLVRGAGPGFAPDIAMVVKKPAAHPHPSMLSIATTQQQMLPNVFGHVEHRTGPPEMMSFASHSGNTAVNLNMPFWSGMLPEMGSDPPPDIFGISPDIKYSCYGQGSLEMAGEIPNGMQNTHVSPVQYQNFVDAQHVLPLRGVESQQTMIMSEEDVMMGMTGRFY